jgi:SOS response regulatory protein OraA/RecX
LLRHRDHARAELVGKLEARGFRADECDDAVATLRRTGLLDDGRYASSRAAARASRGAGDALIRHDLVRAGVDAADVEHALAALEPESDRARRIVERRGAGAKTCRYLRAKGFSEEVVSALDGSDW